MQNEPEVGVGNEVPNVMNGSPNSQVLNELLDQANLLAQRDQAYLHGSTSTLLEIAESTIDGATYNDNAFSCNTNSGLLYDIIISGYELSHNHNAPNLQHEEHEYSVEERTKIDYERWMN